MYATAAIVPIQHIVFIVAALDHVLVRRIGASVPEYSTGRILP